MRLFALSSCTGVANAGDIPPKTFLLPENPLFSSPRYKFCMPRTARLFSSNDADDGDDDDVLLLMLHLPHSFPFFPPSCIVLVYFLAS